MICGVSTFPYACKEILSLFYGVAAAIVLKTVYASVLGEKVVIWTPQPTAISRSFFPANSATARRLSDGDNPKNCQVPLGRRSLVRVGKDDHGQGRPSTASHATS